MPSIFNHYPQNISDCLASFLEFIPGFFTALSIYAATADPIRIRTRHLQPYISWNREAMGHYAATGTGGIMDAVERPDEG